MILLWSPHQSGPAHRVIDYLLAGTVSKRAGGRICTTRRTPPPEILHGDAALVSLVIDALPYRCRYRCATLSWSEEELDIHAWTLGAPELRAAVDGAIRLFLELACAGLSGSDRPPMLISTHTHLGRLEVSILMPRVIGTPDGGQRSWNPHPPTASSRADWDAYVDVVNDHNGWFDPRCPLRRRAITVPSWMVKEVSELRRRSRSGTRQSVVATDPRFRAWALARRAVREGAVQRGDIRDHIETGLAASGWSVTSESSDGITCGPEHGPGPRITIRGAALGDGTEGSVDTYDRLVARRLEIARARERLCAALDRRGAYNRRLLGQRVSVETLDPVRCLARPRPLGALRDRLTHMLVELGARLQRSLIESALTRAMQTYDPARLSATADLLESIDDHPASRPAHRAADRTSRDHDRARDDIAGDRETGPDPRAAHADRPEPPCGGRDFAERGPIPRGPDGCRCDERLSGPDAGRAPDPPRGAAPDADGVDRSRPTTGLAARWSRADWMIHMRRLVERHTTADCPINFRTRENEEIVAHLPGGEVALPISPAAPDRAWSLKAAAGLAASLTPDARAHSDPAPDPSGGGFEP